MQAITVAAMSEEEKAKPVPTWRKELSGLTMAALFTSGCGAPLQAPVESPRQEAVPATPPRAASPEELYTRLPLSRVKATLLINDAQIALPALTDSRDAPKLSKSSQREVDKWLRHPERITLVGIKLEDLAGELAPCPMQTRIPSENRTAKDVQALLRELITKSGVIMMAVLCDADTISNQPPPQSEPEPVDPRTVVRREDKHDPRTLEGRLRGEVLQRNG